MKGGASRIEKGKYGNRKMKVIVGKKTEWGRREERFGQKESGWSSKTMRWN